MVVRVRPLRILAANLQILYITYIHTYLGDVSTGVMRAVAIEAVGASNEISSFLFFRANMSP